MTSAEIDEFVIERDEDHLRVELAHWSDSALAARGAGFTYFSFLSAVDWLPNPSLDGEQRYAALPKETPVPEVITDPVIRRAGGTSRFSLVALLQNLEQRTRLFLTTEVGDELTAPSWTPVFDGAEWHERETWEMFGISFDGHPGLRHLYLPEEFVGHPLRKDFELPARLVRPWPGLVDMEEMPEATQ